MEKDERIKLAKRIINNSVYGATAGEKKKPITYVKLDDRRILMSINRGKEQFIRDIAFNHFIYLNDEYVNVDHIISIWED